MRSPGERPVVSSREMAFPHMSNTSVEELMIPDMDCALTTFVNKHSGTIRADTKAVGKCISTNVG
jgi:hypothetical protein